MDTECRCLGRSSDISSQKCFETRNDVQSVLYTVIKPRNISNMFGYTSVPVSVNKDCMKHELFQVTESLIKILVLLLEYTVNKF